MTPKAFTAEARAAIEAQRGALFDAIANAYIAANMQDTDDPDELNVGNEADEGNGPTDPYEHVPALLNNFANPFIVHLVYAFYKTTLPTHVSVNGHHIRILAPDDNLTDRTSIMRSFDLIFGGEQGWIEHAMKYRSLGHDRQGLERLAVRWLEGDWQNADFLNECKRVPGFDRQLSAATISEDGQCASDEDMLHLAGYKQMKAQYAREGGRPQDMDELMRAYLSGNEARYQQVRREFAAKGRKGCLGTVLLVSTAVCVAYWLL